MTLTEQATLVTQALGASAYRIEGACIELYWDGPGDKREVARFCYDLRQWTSLVDFCERSREIFRTVMELDKELDRRVGIRRHHG